MSTPRNTQNVDDRVELVELSTRRLSYSVSVETDDHDYRRSSVADQLSDQDAHNAHDGTELFEDATRPQSYAASIGNAGYGSGLNTMQTTGYLEHSPASSTAKSAPPPRNRIYTFWVDGWTSETLSSALSIAALICLIATLRYFDGYVVTEMPLKISVNTLVAVFTAIIKSSLLVPVAEGIYPGRDASLRVAVTNTD
jgi:hypothetical protein